MNKNNAEICVAYPLFFEFIGEYPVTLYDYIYLRARDKPAAYAVEAGDEGFDPILVRAELVKKQISNRNLEIMGEL